MEIITSEQISFCVYVRVSVCRQVSIKRLLPDLPAIVEVILVAVYSRNNYQNVETPDEKVLVNDDILQERESFSKEIRDLLPVGRKARDSQSHSHFSCFCMRIQIQFRPNPDLKLFSDATHSQ